MLNYDEFVMAVKENIRDYLPAEYKDASIDIYPVIKNNDTVRDGFCIRPKNVDAREPVPTFYLDSAYSVYERRNDTLDNVLKELVNNYIEKREEKQDLQVDKLQDVSWVKERITCNLINLDNNEKYLEDKPYRVIEDLALVYRIKMKEDGEGVASIVLTNRLAEEFNLSPEELYNIAMENMSKQPIVVQSMGAIMENILRDKYSMEGISESEIKEELNPIQEEELPMLIVSNESGINGAVCILNPEIQEQIAERVGGDYYVLPSSIHEVIVVPQSIGDQSVEELQDMVQDVNQNCVSPDEKLSDHVYEYKAKEHVFQMCVPEREHEHTNEQKMLEHDSPQLNAPAFSH